MNNKKLRIIPLGGLGEVGKNMMLYEYDDQIMVVDTGIMFPENDMLGIDYIIPDFEYLIKNKDKVVGIVITHGHEDHTGAINHVLEHIQVPIYATKLTRGLLEVKLRRGAMHEVADLHTISADDVIDIGPFQVEFFHVSHSIPDSVGLGITTPVGLVVHTGDYKFDPTPVDGWPTDFAKLAEFSGRGVLALMADSTNADKPGWTQSERVIDPEFEKAFSEAPGRVIVASFASLISRMQQVLNAAERVGRKVAFVGMSMTDNFKMAQDLGYLDIHEDLVVSIDEALKMTPKEVVLMGTGSQGEPTSIMGRLSMGTNRRFDILDDDTIILSSHAIPGNEEVVYRTINKLFRRGANVLYEPLAPVHVSGHASQDEMKLMMHLVKPKFMVPIHGELRHLKQHAVLAEEAGILAENIHVIENGEILEVDQNSMEVVDRIPGGYVFVDGSRVGEIGPSVMREREALARDGVVFVHLTLDGGGKLREEPEIITRGFVYRQDSDELIRATQEKVEATIRSSKGNYHDAVTQTVRTFLYEETKTRPVVFVSLSWF